MQSQTASEMNNSTWQRRLSGAFTLAVVSFRRQVWSRQTIVSAMLLGFAILVALAWSIRRERTAVEFVSEILIPVYTSFLLPVFCLCYAAASIAGDREDQTLPYLLVSPLPRPLVYFAKYVAALVLSLLWTAGGLLLLCQVAGPSGRQILAVVWPAVIAASFAYVGLFHLFSVAFRRATIVGFVYALFLENLVGSMPGIVKRVAISFYTECTIFAAAADLGVGPAGEHNPSIYLPIAGPTALLALCTISGLTLVLGILSFRAP